MDLTAAFTEFAYSKDWSPATRAWYDARLGSFAAWAAAEGVTELEAIAAPLVRRYIDWRRNATSPTTGKPLDSFTLHGHVRAIRALLNWAAREDLLDEKVVRRIALPKREHKVLSIFTPDQLAKLFAACENESPEFVARDKAILALLTDTGLRASELCGLTLDRVVLTQEDAYLLLHGKGRKQREVGLGKKARTLLHRYIHRYRRRTDDPPCVHREGWLPTGHGRS